MNTAQQYLLFLMWQFTSLMCQNLMNHRSIIMLAKTARSGEIIYASKTPSFKTRRGEERNQ